MMMKVATAAGKGRKCLSFILVLLLMIHPLLNATKPPRDQEYDCRRCDNAEDCTNCGPCSYDLKDVPMFVCDTDSINVPTYVYVCHKWLHIGELVKEADIDLVEEWGDGAIVINCPNDENLYGAENYEAENDDINTDCSVLCNKFQTNSNHPFGTDCSIGNSFESGASVTKYWSISGKLDGDDHVVIAAAKKRMAACPVDGDLDVVAHAGNPTSPPTSKAPKTGKRGRRRRLVKGKRD